MMSEAKKSSRPAQALPPTTPADISVFEDKGAFVLRDQNGMALYTYDLDVDGKPHCVDACAVNWPPVLASSGSSSVVGEWKTIKRGTALQWTFRGKPVYTHAKDAPGETKGDGVNGKWRLVSL
jgi:predicted lipoprotein with Yx(FWY)xxD motif